MPGVSCTGERSGAVVIPQCVGGSPGPTESEMPGARSALNQSASALAVPWSRTCSSVSASCGACACSSGIRSASVVHNRSRLGAGVTGREVAEGAGVEDLVDGLVDEAIEPEAVRVVPEELHHLPEIAVVDECGPRRDQAGDHDSVRLEPAVTGGNDRNQHPFVDPEPSEPLGDDHIDTFRELDVGDVTVDHVDDLGDSVRRGQLLRQDGDGGPLHRVDARSSRPCREHAQDAASGPDVEDDVAGAHHRVDRTPEGLGANAVADHRPMHLELRVHGVRRVPNRRAHSRSAPLRRTCQALAVPEDVGPRWEVLDSAHQLVVVLLVERSSLKVVGEVDGL